MQSNPGQLWPNFGRLRPGSPKFGRSRPNFVQNSPEIAQIWPPGQPWPSSDKVRPKFGRSRPQIRPQIRPRSPKFGGLLANFARTQARFRLNRATLVKHGQQLTEFGARFGRHRRRAVECGPSGACIGSTSAESAQAFRRIRSRYGHDAKRTRFPPRHAPQPQNRYPTPATRGDAPRGTAQTWRFGPKMPMQMFSGQLMS